MSLYFTHSSCFLLFLVTTLRTQGCNDGKYSCIRDFSHAPQNMGVSKNRGTPKSSILIGFSHINHPFWGTPIFGNTHIASITLPEFSQWIPHSNHDWKLVQVSNSSCKLGLLGQIKCAQLLLTCNE